MISVKKGKGPEVSSWIEKDEALSSLSEQNLRDYLTKFQIQLEKSNLDIFSPEGYQELVTVLNAFSPEIYQKYDDFITNRISPLENQIKCFKGCCYCCVHNITSVEPFEVIYLDGYLKQLPNYSSLLVSIFQRQNEYKALAESEAPYDEDKVLYKYFLKDLYCPFLGANRECTIYEMRPMPCRMFCSLSEPATCQGTKTVSPENKNFIVELPDDIEVILSQIRLHFEKLEISEFFFSGLLRVNELFGQFFIK
jgi:Fe-S-cluster containining protein